MAVAAQQERPPTSPAKRIPDRGIHLRALPPQAEDIAEGAVSGVAGALYGLPGVVLAVALLGFAGWIIDHIRVLEEEREDRIDVEEARRALAEDGSISLADLKTELSL
ncbi:MAG: hypothetical protein WKH64_01180 [Chloroflexia bacterium]